MTNVTPFNFDAQPIRIRDQDGQLWFVAADICAALDITSHRDAVARLDDDERASVMLDTLGGQQPHTAINESGMYKLALRSRKPAAKRFTKWVTSEVLPSIRRTGQYGRPANEIDLSDPATLQRLLLEHTGKVLALENRNNDLEQKAQALDMLTATDGTLTITDGAKVLGMGSKELFRWLEAARWIYRRSGSSHWVGYQNQIAVGNLTHRLTRLQRPDKSTKVVEQVLLTHKGIAALAERIAAEQRAAGATTSIGDQPASRVMVRPAANDTA